MYNVCFMARPSYDKFSANIYASIKDRYDNNIKGYFITMNDKESSYIHNELGNDNIIICEVSKYFKENWEKFTFNWFCEFEKKYDCSPLWSYVYTDRFLINRDYEYVVKITVGYFMFFEDLFTKNEINFFYDETIATLQSYIGYLVGKKLKVKYLCQMTARGGLDASYHYFIDEPFQMDMLFDNKYQTNQYSVEEVNKAEDYLTEFEKTDIKPVNMAFTGQRPHMSLRYFLCPVKYLNRRISKYSNDKYNYMYYQDYKMAMDPIKFYFRYLKSQKFYQKADYSRKYVYFPLHYQPEASTIVCAPKYEKQLYFIDSWAKSLPADTVLYVKEHYALLGNRDISFYKELEKYPNVILINPWESSRSLIENAIAVTTLTGTAGWEAMMLRKPVFLGGEIYFSNAPGVIKIKDIYYNYLPLINGWKQPQRSEIIKYLCEYFRTLRKGNVYSADPASLSKENINLVADSLVQQMNIILNA
ncbi:capsular polysaccharide export protein, LipB/KpsS family [Hungatella hathewayi]|uniref:Capsule polysaccharide biosynthesis protein n=2 Tax=Hungatella hathewayi TaxID=154046 RepID=G5IB40_9FIRM|nr:hypothetical protein [Hungatella hathewayi]EHI61355.1 hypothetical protein HMPREF9473_00717 [ [Hungatella hathewayi WAL-18680]